MMPSSKIDPSSSTPLYIQIGNHLREALKRGEWSESAALPSERQLAQKLGISRITVRRALSLLEEHGDIVRKHGSGTFPAKRIEQPLSSLTGFSDDMRARGLTPSSKWLQQQLSRPTPEEAMALGLAPNVHVARLTRVRYANDEPVAIERATLASHHLPPLDDIGDSLYAALNARGVQPVRALQRIRAVAIRDQEASLLGMDVGAPALLTQRVTYLADGTPLEFTIAHYRGDKYDFIIEMKGARS